MLPALGKPDRKGAWWLVGALAWMGLIYFGFGREAFGSGHTALFLHRVLAALVPDVAGRLSPARVQELDFLVRKAFHLAGYAVLAAFLWRGLGRVFHVPWAVALALAFIVAVGFAVADERHQGHVGGRRAAGTDVVIDAAGAGLGLAALRRASKPKQV